MFDAADNVWWVQDPRGVIASYVYDARDRRTDAYEGWKDGPPTSYARRTTMTYDAVGNLISSSAGLSSTVPQHRSVAGYAYDALNRRTAVTEAVAEPEQRTTTTLYDAADNVREVSRPRVPDNPLAGQPIPTPRNFVTTYAYNRLNQRTGVTEAVGATADQRSATMLYDANGNLLSVTTGLAPGNPTREHRITTSYAYDALDRPIKVIEAWNDDSVKRTTTTAYDAVGNVLAVTNPRGFSTAYDYDTLNRRIQMTDARGPVQTSYDAADNVVMMTNARGVLTRYLYDALNRRTQVIDADNVLHTNTSATSITTTFLYDSAQNWRPNEWAGRRVRVTPPSGAPVRERLITSNTTATLMLDGTSWGGTNPPDNSRYEVIYSERRTTATVYDAADNIRSVTEPDPDGEGPQTSAVTTLAYDDLNRRIEVENALHERTTFVYDAQDNLIGTIDARQVGTSFIYDKLNRRRQTIAAANRPGTVWLDHGPAVTAIDYDALDNVVQITQPDPDGPAPAGPLPAPLTTFAYDAHSRRTEAIDPLGHRTTTIYDAANNLIGTILPRVNADTDPPNDDHRTSFTYDKLNRRTQTIEGTEFGGTPALEALRRITTFTYDRADNLESVKNPLGNVTSYVYDAVNRRIVTVDALGGRTTVSYDANNNLTSLIDPDSNPASYLNQTVYQYDALDRRQKMTDARGKSATYAYYATGTLRSTTDRRGLRRDFTYDELNRPRVETWAPVSGTTPADIITFTYETGGNLREAASYAGRITMTYDALNRVIMVQQGITLNNTYDTAGRRTVVRDSRGAIATSTYDTASRLQTRHLTADGTQLRVNLDYNNRNQLTTLLYERFDTGTMPPTPVAAATGRYLYTHFGERKEIIWRQGTSTGMALHSFAYEYNNAGELTRERRWTDPIDIGDAFTYDEHNAHDPKHQLQDVSSGGSSVASQTFSPNNSRTSQNGGNVEREQGNRLVQDPLWTYTYDDEGNLKGRRAKDNAPFSSFLALQNTDRWEYDYDHANRLVAARKYQKTGDPPLLLETTTFVYDAFGRRIRQTRQAGTLPETVTRFVYDGPDVWADLDNSTTPQVAVHYLHGDQPDQHFARVEGPASPAKQEEPTTFPTGTASWYLTDRLGSVIAIAKADGAGWHKLARYRGFQAVPVCACGPVLRKLDRYEHTGREFDYYTSLQYHRARWYEPLSGRWMSEDPLGFRAGDANLYRYAGNSPANATDPNGLDYTERENGIFYWVIERDGWSFFNPDVRRVAIGAVDGDRVWIYDRFGGGTASRFAIHDFAVKYWNDYADMSGMSERNQDEQLGRVLRERVTRGKGIRNDSEFWQYLSAAGEGLRDGAAIVADTFTFGHIESLHEYVERVVTENGGLYRVSQFSATLGREALITALTLGTAQIARAGVTAGWSARTVFAARAVQPVLLAREAYQTYESGKATVKAYNEGDTLGLAFNAAFTLLGGIGVAASGRASLRMLAGSDWFARSAGAVRAYTSEFGESLLNTLRSGPRPMYAASGLGGAGSFFDPLRRAHRAARAFRRVGYGSDDLSSIALEARRSGKRLLRRHNAVVAEYLDEAGKSQRKLFKNVQGNSRLGRATLHAEEVMDTYFRMKGITPDRVQRVFTEYRPCRTRSCRRLLSTGYGKADVTWSFHYDYPGGPWTEFGPNYRKLVFERLGLP